MKSIREQKTYLHTLTLTLSVLNLKKNVILIFNLIINESQFIPKLIPIENGFVNGGENIFD